MVLHAATADAFSSRLSAQTCWQNDSSASLAGSASASGVFGYLFNSSKSFTTTLFCPIPDNTNQPKNTIGVVNVHGRTATGIASPNATAQKCVVFFDQLGGDCNGAASTTATGVWAISMTGSGVWRLTDASHTGAFPYLSVVLSPSGAASGDFSALFGLFVN